MFHSALVKNKIARTSSAALREHNAIRRMGLWSSFVSKFQASNTPRDQAATSEQDLPNIHADVTTLPPEAGSAAAAKPHEETPLPAASSAAAAAAAAAPVSYTHLTLPTKRIV